MADIAPQPDGSASITVSPAENAGLKALSTLHLPFLKRAAAWFDADVAPELKDAADFLESLTATPDGGAQITVSAAQVQTLRGILAAHIPDFNAVLAVVESPAVRAMLGFARALL